MLVFPAPADIPAKGGLIAIDPNGGTYSLIIGSTMHTGEALIYTLDDRDFDLKCGGPEVIVDLLTKDALREQISELRPEECSEIIDLLDSGRLAPRFEVGTLLINGVPA